MARGETKVLLPFLGISAALLALLPIAGTLPCDPKDRASHPDPHHQAEGEDGDQGDLADVGGDQPHGEPPEKKRFDFFKVVGERRSKKSTFSPNAHGLFEVFRARDEDEVGDVGANSDGGDENGHQEDQGYGASEEEGRKAGEAWDHLEVAWKEEENRDCTRIGPSVAGTVIFL